MFLNYIDASMILRHIVFYSIFWPPQTTFSDMPANVNVDVDTKTFHFVVFRHISNPNIIKTESYFLHEARANGKYISYIVFIIVITMYSQNCEEHGLAEARITKFAATRELEHIEE